MPGCRHQNPKAGFVPPLDYPGAEPWAGSILARKDDGRGHLGLGLGVPGTGAGRGLALRSRGAASAHAGLTRLQPAPTATPGSMKDRTQELRTVSPIPARFSPRAPQFSTRPSPATGASTRGQR